MFLHQVFDEKLAQYAYIVGCQKTGEAIVIDPERDIDQYVKIAEANGLKITAVTETHIHADFLSGARQFAEEYGVKLYLTDEGTEDWKYLWVHDGDYDYKFIYDGDVISVGNIEIKALHTPGHTPEHLTFQITDLGGGANKAMGLATGDFVFVGDIGRPDLLESAAGMVGVMEPSARQLYHTITKWLKTAEDHVQIWPGHGAGSACGKELGAIPMTTVGYEKMFNGALLDAMAGEEQFVKNVLHGQPEPPMYFARMKRDNKTGAPVLKGLPQPKKLSADEFAALAGRNDIAVLDSRVDKELYMKAHLPNALCTPMNKAFNMNAGSYVDENVPMYLIIDEDRVEEAVRDLIRIGLDDIVGYATPQMFDDYVTNGGKTDSVEIVKFNQVDDLAQENNVIILDVRGIVEWETNGIKGSENIAHTRLWSRRDELKHDAQYVLYCGTGSRSAYGTGLLKHLGFNVRGVVLDNYEEYQLAHA